MVVRVTSITKAGLGILFTLNGAGFTQRFRFRAVSPARPLRRLRASVACCIAYHAAFSSNHLFSMDVLIRAVISDAFML